MSTHNVTRCDFCGKEKGETNHWHSMLVTQMGILWIGPLKSFADSASPKDACGHQCVTQGVARYLDHHTLEER